jgi:hypothetical protein
MATCNLTTLESTACSNGFLSAAQDKKLVDALELQLLYQIAGSSGSLSSLQFAAGVSGFTGAAQVPKLFVAAKLQLLCNISGG